MTTNDIDARTIAADIMCGNARSITPGEIWGHIGQAYDLTEVDAAIADEVAELIGKTGIDLIWPDGSKNTELDAARVEIDRLAAELARLRAELEQTNGAAGLTEEPGPEVTKVYDAEGDVWIRSPEGWRLRTRNGDGDPWSSWQQIAALYGPMTALAAERARTQETHQ